MDNVLEFNDADIRGRIYEIWKGHPKMSQADIGDAIGISQLALRYFLDGKSSPKRGTKIRMLAWIQSIEKDIQ